MKRGYVILPPCAVSISGVILEEARVFNGNDKRFHNLADTSAGGKRHYAAKGVKQHYNVENKQVFGKKSMKV